MGSDPRTLALRALSHFIVSDSPLEETLLRVSEITTAALPAAAFSGMTLIDERGKPVTAVFTDEESPEIDAAQYRTGEGPCLDAWRHNAVVRVDDTEDDDAPYPEFRRTALAHGIHATLSLPLHAKGEALGALNLYAHEANSFTAEDEVLGAELVEAGAVVLSNSRAYWGAHELSQQLSDALGSRAVIEQAKGILMARDPTIDADAAFELLRSASQRENIKLRDVAERVVASRA
ncbi:GAF and ANTAR domain-containing protein [soil metagenome]